MTSHWTLTTDDGLPSNTIYQIKQDKQDFIWMATDNGLVRYDGRNFKEFNPNGIKDKEIIGLFIDSKNIIWFWNLKGQLFYIKNNEIKQAEFTAPDSKVIGFQQDASGDYWYYDSHGLLKVIDSKKSKSIFKLYGIEGLVIVDNTIFFRASGYIYRIEDDKYVKNYEVFESAFNFKHQVKNFRFYFKYLNNQFWFLNSKSPRLYRIDDNGKFIAFGFQNYRSEIGANINNIFTDNQKNYWVFTDEWIYVFDSTETKKITKFNLPYNSNINTFFHDKEGNYWLSLPKHGIIIFPSLYINKISKLLDDKVGVTSLLMTDNAQLIGFENGQFTHRDLSNNTNKVIDLNLNEPVKQFTVEKKDRVWVNTDVRSYFYNLKTNTLIRNFNNQVNINYKNVYIDDEQIFLGNFDGVLQSSLSEVVKILKKLSWKQIKKKGIKGINKRVYSIEKIENEYWFGSTDGLYYYKKDSARLTEIQLLTDSWITHIIYKKGTVWVGTQTDGVFEIINKKIINHYDESNGLISNNCKQLIVESNDIIWVGTNNGINKINAKNGNIELINDLDGLPNNDITALAVDSQNLYVGTSEGLVRFNKNIQTKNLVPPPIYFSSFQIFEQDTTLSESYVLKHYQNNIRIGFTSVSFRSQGGVRYKYRMIGLSNDWSETQSDYVSYPVLNSGNYTFEAYAINEDGIGSEQPIVINITIQKPFWATWWFRGFIIGVIGLMVWLILLVRIKRLRKELNLRNEYQQKLNELEMQALQAQMNPHFIFNVLNSIQHYLILNDGEQAMIYLGKFAKLIRMIFDFSRKPTISLYQEVNFLKLYIDMEKLRFKQKVEVNLTIDDTIFENEIYLPPLLIQPIVENCFKHGLLHKENGGKAHVDFKVKNGWIVCVVEDNGIGREAAKKLKKWNRKTHKSAGIGTTKERLELWLSKKYQTVPKDAFKILDLVDENKQVIGTRVEILLQENINSL